MTLLAENWAELLEPGLRQIYHLRMRAREALSRRTDIFPVAMSRRAFERTLGIGELSAAGWNNFHRTRQVTYDRFERGFASRLVHRTFALGVEVEKELLEDNLYEGAGLPREVTGRVEKLADSAWQHREISGAALLNNAFIDSGTDDEGMPIAGPDGVGLCSTAHPLGPGNSTTWSNEGNLAFTPENVKETHLRMKGFTDDRGGKIAVFPNELWVPSELEDRAEIIAKTLREVDSANNNINTLAGRYRTVVWDYLEDPDAWFMVDGVLKEQHLVWYDRVLPEYIAATSPDQFTGRWIGRHRFSRGWDDARFIYGNKPN